MMQCSEEGKEAVLKKIIPPHNPSIIEPAREEGIIEATLYLWRRRARERGLLLPDSDRVPDVWSARDKFNAVRVAKPRCLILSCWWRSRKAHGSWETYTTWTRCGPTWN